jgi:hypothetical protein
LVGEAGGELRRSSGHGAHSIAARRCIPTVVGSSDG